LRNSGILPKYLREWEDILIFAAEFKILLPQNENVARAMFRTEDFPDIKWVCGEYEKLIEYVLENHKEMLTDPVVPKQVPTPGTFDRILEGSVSNTEERKCSDPPPPTSSIISTSTGLPNCSVTAGKTRSPLPQLSTPSPGQ
jgi:hypothetical protein